jgi:hypothetical protein
MYDPRKHDAPLYVARFFHETPEDAWRRQERYLENKLIGRPKATAYYTVEQLESMNMVGIYMDGETDLEQKGECDANL